MNKVELLSNALEYIEKNLENELKTEDVARNCYCSKSTLEKLFRCVNGITVREYLVRRRMMKAARMLVEQPQTGILDIALQYGYSSNESFARAFKQIWNCNPSEFRSTLRFLELFPRIYSPLENGDDYMKERRNVDISEMYDLFAMRKECYFICADIKNMTSINEISRRAGDLALLEVMKRLDETVGADDVVFRIGGDEFAVLTNTKEEEEAKAIAKRIKSRNKEQFMLDGDPIPLSLHVGTAKFEQPTVRYNELFTGLHMAIKDSKGE